MCHVYGRRYEWKMSLSLSSSFSLSSLSFSSCLFHFPSHYLSISPSHSHFFPSLPLSFSLPLSISLRLTLSLPPPVFSLFIFPFLLRHICMRLSTRSLMREPRPVLCYAQCTRTACSPQLRYVLTRHTLFHDDLSS